jgi:hypothetical protein
LYFREAADLPNPNGDSSEYVLFVLDQKMLVTTISNFARQNKVSKQNKHENSPKQLNYLVY